MAIYMLDEKEIAFPNPRLANEDGLLAAGGDLSVERLLLAYSNGIFPWYSTVKAPRFYGGVQKRDTLFDLRKFISPNP